MIFTDAVDEFLLSRNANCLSKSTLKWYTSMLKSIADHFGQHQLTDISVHDLREYIVSLRSRDARYIDAPQKPSQTGGLSVATVNGHITALHSFFKWASDEYQIQNPMAKIARPKRKQIQTMVKAVAPQDFIKLFEATGDDEAGARDRALLAFLADTGARLGGVIGLKVSDLDLKRRYALVTEKGNKSRRVPFTHYTARLLNKWLNIRSSETDFVFVSMNTGTALSDSGVNQVLKRLKQRAGVTGRVNPHSFRHSFAREYIKNGGDVVTLAKLLGHSDTNITTAYYAIFTEDEIADQHDRFSPLQSLLYQAGNS